MEVDAKVILYMLAKEFGLGRDSFAERLRLQKVIYLLEASGAQLGYGFGWYKYGPYSQDLVSDAYAVLGSQKSEYERAAFEGNWCFSNETKERFDKFRETCSDYLASPEKAELLASVRFIKKMWCSSDIDREEFVDEFKKHKRQLYNNNEPVQDSEIKAAFDICGTLLN